MATAVSSATMAAAGFGKPSNKRSSTASSCLQTPGSGTFPSELLSPMTGSPGFMKRDDALKTPITPPSAYLDFLKNITPAIQSPASTTSARFSFNEKSFDRLSDKASDYSAPKSSISPPTSQPPLSRNPSSDSNTSDNSVASVATTSSAAGESSSSTRPESPRIIIPPSPFAKPAAPRSARTPRRLHIPQSPFPPAIGSAHSVPSPYSSTPLSAAPWSASFSPRDNNGIESINQPGKVHVRHVVTRTVTYCRTPLDPAPKGKRRKIEVEEDDASSSSSTSKAPSEEPPLKQERIEKIEEESESTAESASASASEA